MPGNDFEKQVQQKMDELKFVPSDNVWPAVQKEIADRKKRRPLLIWLLIGGLFLGGAASFYIAGTGNKDAKELITGKPVVAFPKENKINNKPGSVTASVNPIQPAGSKDSNSLLKHTLENNDFIAGNTSNKQRPTKGTSNKNVQGRTETTGVATDAYNKHLRKKNVVTVPVVKDDEDKFSHHIPALTSKGNKKGNHDNVKADEPVAAEKMIDDEATAITKKENNKVPKNIHENNSQDNEAALPDSAKTSIPLVVKSSAKSIAQNKNNSDSAKAIASNKKTTATTKKITWGINLGGGISNISKGFSGLFSANPTYANVANFQNSSPATGGSLAGPSRIKPGLFYAAGMFVRKPVGKNFSILAGLNYVYNSNHIEVGSKINSSSSISNGATPDQYSTGSASTYTNHFHFIELPVIAEKQLGKTARLNLYGGMSFSLLAATNVLVYDAQKNVYETNKSQVNKMQIGLLAGFGYRLFSNTHPVEIGPQINYDISSIFKKELYGGRHLFAAGISAKVFFHKK